jgi:hypothetical protein
LGFVKNNFFPFTQPSRQMSGYCFETKVMKTTTMKRAITVLVAGIVLFACKKEKDKAPGCPVTMESLSGAYKLTALQYRASAGAVAADYLAYMDDCQKDDVIYLNDDGSYREDDAGTVCDPTEAAAGTWQLHGTTLVSDGTVNGTIASFDCKTLVFYIDNAIKPGDRLTYTMEKQ